MNPLSDKLIITYCTTFEKVSNVNISIHKHQLSSLIVTEPYDFFKEMTEKKNSTFHLFNIYRFTNNKAKADRVFNCCSYLETFTDADNNTKIKNSNFCRVRLCPMCNSRLSKKRFSNLFRVSNELEKIGKYQTLLLTLTVKNPDGANLRSTIKDMIKAWGYISNKNPIFNKSIKGWYRSLEITYNPDTKDYHPHLHMMLVVKPHYFRTEYYITQQTWLDMWQSALKINYAPVVDIRKAYINPNRKGESTVISEVCKYVTKSNDYIIPDNIKLSADIVEVLDGALRRVREVAYGGILKVIYEKLKVTESNYADSTINKDLKNKTYYSKWQNHYRKYKIFNPYQSITNNEPNP